MSSWLESFSPNAVGYASVGAIAIGAFVAWRIARRVVQIGYFLLYFLVGFGIVYAASAYGTRSFDVPLSMPIVGGLAFAAAAMAIRAKLMRIVSVVMLAALFSLGGKFWSQVAESHRAAAPNGAEDRHRREAAAGLATVRRQFGLIAESLPKEEGRLRGGYLTQADLAKLGIRVELQKVVERPAWHTWLTGLYDLETEDEAVWYPSGDPQEAKKRLKLAPAGYGLK